MHKYFAEFIGTFLLSFVIFYTGNYLAIGAALAVGVMLFKNLSGGAFNPAITLAMAFEKKLSNNDILPYIICQIAGALAGCKIIKYM